MHCALLAQVTQLLRDEVHESVLGYLFFGLAFLLLILGTIFFVGWRLSHRSHSKSPFGAAEMRPGKDLTFEAMQSVHRFLLSKNKETIDLNQAAICQRTSRIFPHAMLSPDRVVLRRDYVRTYASGDWVSWGSLSPEAKIMTERLHGDLSAYQIEYSSPLAEPNQTSAEYYLRKPGPLYVDRKTFALLGWQIVPETDLEVLVYEEGTKK